MKTSKKNGDDPKSLAELKIEYDPRNDNDPKEGKEGVGGYPANPYFCSYVWFLDAYASLQFGMSLCQSVSHSLRHIDGISDIFQVLQLCNSVTL